MPGGRRDSSKTRVVPVFEQLRNRDDDWVRNLLSLPRYGSGVPAQENLDLGFVRGYWGAEERGLPPPVSLLSWLIRNLSLPLGPTTLGKERAKLLERNPTTIEEALTLLRTANLDSGWWIFEGRSYPDVFLETQGAVVVIEGKRTEAGPTTCTTWMRCRHQMWRHMDAAWEVRGRRAVFGFFLVEGDPTSSNEVPHKWREAAADAVSTEAVAGSFPHRSFEEQDAITKGFLGVATWQQLCACFAIDYSLLPDRVDPNA